MKFNEQSSFNPDELREPESQAAIKRITNLCAESAAKRLFAANPGAWIFIFCAIALCVILSVFPIFSHRKEVYCILDLPGGGGDNQGIGSFFSIMIFGALAAFSLRKSLKIVFSVLAIVPPCLYFLLSGKSVIPSWGLLIYLCAAACMLMFACSDPAALGVYPSPLRDTKARRRWIYVALCAAAMLWFTWGNVFSGESDSMNTDGWHWMSLVPLDGADGLGYILLFCLLPLLAALLVFTPWRLLHIMASISLFVPAIILAADKDTGYLHFSTGYYMYLLCAAAISTIAVMDTLGSPGMKKTVDTF